MPAKAHVMVFASQKGGSGKTTVSAHMAVEAERAGFGPVALIDTDPQGSMAKWWNVREADTPAFAQASVEQLDADIQALSAQGYRLIIIDTPPAVTHTIAEVIAHADLVVLPTRPSPHDLRAVGATVDIAEHQGKPVVFVVNSATARARITGETAVALSQHGMVAPVTLHHRVDFAASMIDGRTVGELNASSRSAQECQRLWAYLQDRVLRLSGDPRAADLSATTTLEAGILTPGMGQSEPEPAAPALPPQTAHPPAPPPAPVARFGSGQGLPPGPPEPINENWDGIDRRKADTGPPPGKPDRRVARQPFGGRFTA